ncbi:hypothetical protein B0T11DRAFT_345320 [Plectosphaerella cucumerina]|uniref:Alpha-galactosidase A n=1 Tax=Plectosphaerella cucumerina TaxID=40658 RepID=A0A8K0TN48_9PEZI|nr:hypothetical protein B0T11DRAFT_345320 [Plectosphaerella cucumerina]
MTSTRDNNIQLLATLVDAAGIDESEYRFLVDGKHVKYVSVDPGLLPKNDRTFAPVLLGLLPPFPSGDWNEAINLPGINNLWHPTRIDFLEFSAAKRIRQNIHIVTHPSFPRPVLIKFAEFPWQIPFFEAETVAYAWIDKSGIGPGFLGHLTEEGRVIGFILEYVEDARTAETEDLAACQGLLSRLHALGIKHGDINKYNLLLRHDRVVMVDFETAERCNKSEELGAELQLLEQSLRDTSRRGAT